MLLDRSHKKYLPLEAQFIGRDKSCGFRKNAVYSLKVVTKPGYIVIYSNCGCSLYDSWKGFFANWKPV